MGSNPTTGVHIKYIYIYIYNSQSWDFLFILLIHTAEAGSSWTRHFVYAVEVIHNEQQNRQDSNPSSAFVGRDPLWRACWSLFPSLDPRPSFKVVLPQVSVWTIWLSYLKIHRTVSLDPMQNLLDSHFQGDDI
jgi:hypothetical protein